MAWALIHGNTDAFTGSDGRVMEVTVIEDKIADGAWETLSTFPVLNLDGQISPWELDEAYRRWKDSCGMAAAGVAWEFATFVREMFQ